MSETLSFHRYKAHTVTPQMKTNIPFTDRCIDPREQDTLTNTIVWQHEAWSLSNRPFYNVYPTVVKCLGNTSLAFSLSQLVKFFEPTAICFAVGHELRIKNQLTVTSVVVSVTPAYTLDPREGWDHPICTVVANVTYPNGGVGIILVVHSGDGLVSDNPLASKHVELLRLCLGVIMLSKDPDFAERILLNRDRKRIDRLNTPEKMQQAVDRAVRNGRNGWTIGEHLTVSPHTRRPHFAIRWTGKGRLVPKLCPIKGCVVKSSRLYPIPTGYMDK